MYIHIVEKFKLSLNFGVKSLQYTSDGYLTRQLHCDIENIKRSQRLNEWMNEYHIFTTLKPVQIQPDLTRTN